MPDQRQILLVEDSADDVELITAALKKQQLENRVDVARDGEQALDYLHRRGRFAGRDDGNPGLVILDLKLPKLSGFEVLTAMRGDRALRHLPVVVLTSSREERDLVRSYEAGTNAYVVKPVAYADFVAAVREIGVFWTALNELPKERPAT
jgi:DNA-binding response OmpR family regulator